MSTTNHAAGFLIWNFVYAYAILAPRGLKIYLKIDHNAAPREDIDKYAVRMVQEGKMKQGTLDLLKRCRAAHENSVEGYPLFVGAVLFALVARLDHATINTACTVYTAARLAYGALYLLTETEPMSFLRTFAWYTATLSCLALIWKGGNALNAGSLA
jgi:uncharacterized MAPEG superfamily protein